MVVKACFPLRWLRGFVVPSFCGAAIVDARRSIDMWRGRLGRIVLMGMKARTKDIQSRFRRTAERGQSYIYILPSSPLPPESVLILCTVLATLRRVQPDIKLRSPCTAILNPTLRLSVPSSCRSPVTWCPSEPLVRPSWKQSGERLRIRD